MSEHHAIAIVSGGMDSVTLAYWLARHPANDGIDRLTLLSVDYGQRHVKELAFAEKAAADLGAEHVTVPLPLGTLLTGSALTDANVEVPEGHYADESMRATVVPNRNAIMLSVATALAVSRQAGTVATAVHAGDHPIYPDCRPAFINAFNRMAVLANEGFLVDGFAVIAPFVQRSKAQIVTIGDQLGVPFADTWSCYQGREVHCGRCATCVERAEAFAEAGVPDPTTYEDPDHWRTVV